MICCPECGSIACPQGERIKGRVVYGCSNPACGHVFYRYRGKIVTVERRPWTELHIGTPVEQQEQPEYRETTEWSHTLQRDGTVVEGFYLPGDAVYMAYDNGLEGEGQRTLCTRLDEDLLRALPPIQRWIEEARREGREEGKGG